MARKLLTLDNVNPLLRDMGHGDTGPISTRATEIERELRKGIMKPFTEVIRADINDIQAMGQKPISFTRQVLTACSNPNLLSDPFIPADVKVRANKILDECGGRSAGAYTYSEGIQLIRQHIAQYLERRDGITARVDDIFIGSGSNEALRTILNVLNHHQDDRKIGVIVPVPRDPFFTALCSELGIIQIDYYLDEECDWSVNPEELLSAWEAARRYCVPKAILVINPGNPTGSVLCSENMEEIVRFAVEKKLVLLADEAYQFNAFLQGCRFQSFKKVMKKMGSPYDRLELISTMSASTGILGECGLRCGCSEVLNLHEDVLNVYTKSTYVKMCSSVVGQIAFDCMVCPPLPSEISYQKFRQEWTSIMQDLNEKAQMTIRSLNSMDGMECSIQTAATFVFPKIQMPERAIMEAQIKGQSPDMFYALGLLEETGVCVLPGVLYGQLPGTYHIRITILQDKENIRKIMEAIKKFNSLFLLKYS